MLNLVISSTDFQISPGEWGFVCLRTGTFSDSSVLTLASASWNSSNANIATVTSDSTNSGTVYATAAGTTTVDACAGSICGSATVTVPSAQLTAITITPTNAAVVNGSTIAFFRNRDLQ
ncbi:MAG: hypothetical protein DMG32_02895 [Acidobacteria bacterium]|nr:MAG: hypothetical protein DMG32_02895 [Acidobacteriota bacterium]